MRFAFVGSRRGLQAIAEILAQVEALRIREQAVGKLLVYTGPATGGLRVADLAGADANLVGGDILTGASTLRRALFGARMTMSPYATGITGVFICSAATPPGPGAHGMSGYYAALASIEAARRRR